MWQTQILPHINLIFMQFQSNPQQFSMALHKLNLKFKEESKEERLAKILLKKNQVLRPGRSHSSSYHIVITLQCAGAQRRRPQEEVTRSTSWEQCSRQVALQPTGEAGVGRAGNGHFHSTVLTQMIPRTF